MSNHTEQHRLEKLKALGFESELDYQDHQRVMQASKDLGAKQKADSIAAGSTAFQQQGVSNHRDARRDYQYKLLVNSAEFIKGDAYSIGMLFCNLSGKNFTQRVGHDQTHAEWLAYMSAEYSTELCIGARVQLCNPEGSMLQESEIGKELPACVQRKMHEEVQR